MLTSQIPQPLLLCKEVNHLSLVSGAQTLWTYHGGILIYNIAGCVTVGVQAQSTTCKISAKNGILSAVDLCANFDLNAATPNTMLTLPAAPASAMIATPLGAAYTLPALPYLVMTPGVGLITVTYGASSSGQIVWQIFYALTSPSSTLV